MSLKEIKARGEQGKGMSMAGLICSIIGTLLYGIILLFVIIVFVVAFNSDYSNYSNNFYY
jgi:uncharacterized protein YggT (Ycf19 family)